MTTPTRTDFEALREAAFAAVVVNDTDMLHQRLDERPGLAGRQASVRRALHADVARLLDAATRVLFPRRTARGGRDRMIDVSGL